MRSGGPLTEAVVCTSRLITESYPDGLCQEAIDRRRIDKLTNEAGEVQEAYDGWVGENPRKGVCDTLDHVLEELLDVALTALGAYEHLTGFEGTCLRAMTAQAWRKLARLEAAIEAAP